MARKVKFGEFRIKVDGGVAKVYDSRTKKKLFEGPLATVMMELSEKIEGEIKNAKRGRYI